MSIFGAVYAGIYDLLADREDRRGAAELRKRTVEHAAGRVLEIGTGTGRCLRFYADAEYVLAIEPDPNMRARAARRASAATAHIEVRDGDATAIDLPDDSFDEVVTCWVLCTVPDPLQALAEIQRVLRSGGRLRFCEHVRADDPTLAARQDRLAPSWRRVARGCRCNQDTRTLIDRAGFVDIESVSLEPAFTSPRIVRPTILGTALAP